MLVKWLPALARHCCWTRRLETKGLLVSPPPPLPPDRFFLFNQRVKKGDGGGGGGEGGGMEEGQSGGGGLKARAAIRKISLGSSRCRALATRKGSQQDACSHCHTASTPPPRPPRAAPVAHLAFSATERSHTLFPTR